MHHLYLSYQPSVEALSTERGLLEGWCGKEGIKEFRILEEKLIGGRISPRMIERLLRDVEKGDTVVVYSLTRLGRSINMLVGVMRGIYEKGASIYTIDDARIFRADKQTDEFISGMELTSGLLTKIKTERNNEAMFTTRKKGMRQGRPVGARKKECKKVLFGKTDQIVKMRSKGMTLAEIAKALDVSSCTIHNYLASLK